PFTAKAKPAIGLSGVPERLKVLGGISEADFEPLTIELLDAASTFEDLRRRHPGSPILLKLDAEGAEYGIIERLASTRLLSGIWAASIEWHGEPGPAVLEEHLRNAGFRAESHALEDGTIGVINAFRDRY